MKTYSAKPSDVTRQWYLIDASEAPLGRLATKVATLLTGKGKPQFTKHIDCGDYVVVINAAQSAVTGDKQSKKIYYRHTNYPGGLKQATLAEKRPRIRRLPSRPPSAACCPSTVCATNPSSRFKSTPAP